MADLDTDLSRRLSQLAAAVPIARGDLDPVHHAAVAARQSVRMAWITPLVVLVAAVVVGSLLTGRGAEPGPGATPGTEPSVSSDRDGNFFLELHADKRMYSPDEPIIVVASLLFDGPAVNVTFKHDSNGPIVFGIREPVFGGIQVGEISLLMWDQTTLGRLVPLVQPFQKGGAFDGEHPDAEKLRAWFEDPALRLPEGTWHLFARASGSTPADEDEARLFSLATEIEIVVDDPATPGHPSATAWADKPVYGGDDIGNMTLQVRSAHATYAAGSPIELDTYYSLAEGPPLAEGPFVQEAAFSIVQVDLEATEIRTLEPELQCGETSVGRGEERHVPITDGNVVLIKAVSWPQTSSDSLKRGVVELPVGRWRITAVVSAHFGPCGAPTETWQVHASVEVDVVPAS